MRVPLAWDPVGIGDTWTGIAIPVLLFGLWWLWALYGFEVGEALRRRLRRQSTYERHEAVEFEVPAKLTRGVVFCDWVDVAALTSVAHQKGVEPQPQKTERAQAHDRSTEVGGALGKLRALRGSKRTDENRQTFEHSEDPNKLLVSVMDRLGDDGLIRNLDEAPVIDPYTDEALDDLVRTARKSPAGETAREAIRALQDDRRRDALQTTWEWSSQREQFVLLESTWEIIDPSVVVGPTNKDAQRVLLLRLSKLREPSYVASVEHGNPPEFPTLIDVPSGSDLYVEIDRAHLTARGMRLTRHGQTVNAGVLGTTGSYSKENETLNVTPLAVFARIENF